MAEQSNLANDIKKENERVIIIFNNTMKLLKDAHRLAKPALASKEVREVLKNYDREKAIFLIVTNIQKYRKTLEAISHITGRIVLDEPNFYADKVDDIIICDLKYIRNVIYFEEIKNAGLEFALEQVLKKLNVI